MEPVVLYSAPCLLLAEGAESTLNKVQAEWALTLLGCRRGHAVRGLLAVASVGWQMRLGTRMLESGILALARARLYPVEHPLSSMISLAATSPATTWFTRIKEIMCRVGGEQPLPEIIDCRFLLGDRLAEARADAKARKDLVREYRDQVVRPALAIYDDIAFKGAADKWLHPLECPASDVIPCLDRLPMEYFGIEFAGLTHTWLQIWSLVRITGAWPLPLFGAAKFADTLPACPGCGSPDVTITHVLCVCSGAAQDRGHFLVRAMPPSRCDGPVLLRALFGQAPLPGQRALHIQYVGTVLGKCMIAAIGGHSDHEDALEAAVEGLLADARAAAVNAG